MVAIVVNYCVFQAEIFLVIMQVVMVAHLAQYHISRVIILKQIQTVIDVVEMSVNRDERSLLTLTVNE